MLTDLHIENVAVIERADIAFGPGLCALTGETGAGKSIVIDSLEAVLGARTGRELVRHGADKALVSAVFAAPEAAVGWCEENGLEAGEGELVLQRRINAEGKSSCRINGLPVSVSQLRELGSFLLDLHGQNEGVKLLDEARHRAYLDGFGALGAEISTYSALWRKYRATQTELERLSMDEVEKARLIESLSYRAAELERAKLRAGEEEELSSRRDLLRNAEKLTESLDAAYSALYGGETSALSLAGDAAVWTSRAVSWAPELEKAGAEINEALGLLDDAAELLRDFRESLDFSPEEYDRLETRLSLLRRLQKKYAMDEAGLIAELERCRQRLGDLEYADDRLQSLKKELLRDEKALKEASAVLSRAREAAAHKLQSRIESELRDLSMPSARFLVEIAPLGGEPGFDASGADRVRFLMSANAGEEPGRISRIASGGELSRIMLAMKNVLAEQEPTPTMVFDEVDAGVSGVAAARVAEKLARLSRKRQVLCVTHLPQIAAMADNHFLIEKSERAGRTYTEVTELDRESRKAELARLTVGENITLTGLAGAEEQLHTADEYKNKLEQGRQL